MLKPCEGVVRAANLWRVAVYLLKSRQNYSIPVLNMSQDLFSSQVFVNGGYLRTS